jgi:hypothetical protein
VVAIIGILAAIAIPNLITASGGLATRGWRGTPEPSSPRPRS